MSDWNLLLSGALKGLGSFGGIAGGVGQALSDKLDKKRKDEEREKRRSFYERLRANTTPPTGPQGTV